MSRRVLACALLLASLAACDDDMPIVAGGPTPPALPGVRAGSAVFTTADEVLLRDAIDRGVYPASDTLVAYVDGARTGASSSWSDPPCSLLTMVGPRSYDLAGPCTLATGVRYEGKASARNLDMGTLSQPDNVVDGSRPTVVEAHDFVTRMVERPYVRIDGRVELSSPSGPWRAGRDVVTTADVELEGIGAPSRSQLSLVQSPDDFGFVYGPGSRVWIEGLGDFAIAGHIARHVDLSGPVADGWLELRGAETLHVELDAARADRCLTLAIDGDSFGELCPQ